MTITQEIDARIAHLESIRTNLMKQKNINAFEISQVWARIDELKALKAKFTDKITKQWII